MRASDEPVRLTKIYTRGGDAGETSLGDGSRVPKLDLRIAAYGAVDELNAQLGALEPPTEQLQLVRRIQNELFDLGADLSVPYEDGDGRLRVTQDQIDELERQCDRWNEPLPELKSFVLPGGTPLAARFHVARTVCRRAELEALRGGAGIPDQPARARLPEPALGPPVHPLACGRGRRRGPVEAWELALAFAGSFVAGYFGAALGLVLGTLRLPVLAFASGSPLTAAGTNIAISAAAAAAGGLRHAREGRVDWRVVAWMAPPSMLGAVLGALLADDVPERALYALIAAVLVWSGIDLALRPIEARPRERPRLGVAAGSGLVIGAIGGAAGVILGTLRMPALVRSVGLGVRRAAGTNLVVGFFLGVAGFATHAVATGVEWELLAAGLAGALPGAWLGAHVTGVVPENLLRVALGVALVLVGVVFAGQAIVG